MFLTHFEPFPIQILKVLSVVMELSVEIEMEDTMATCHAVLEFFSMQPSIAYVSDAFQCFLRFGGWKNHQK